MCIQIQKPAVKTKRITVGNVSLTQARSNRSKARFTVPRRIDLTLQKEKWVMKRNKNIWGHLSAFIQSTSITRSNAFLNKVFRAFVPGIKAATLSYNLQMTLDLPRIKAV